MSDAVITSPRSITVRFVACGLLLALFAAGATGTVTAAPTDHDTGGPVTLVEGDIESFQQGNDNGSDGANETDRFSVERTDYNELTVSVNASLIDNETLNSTVKLTTTGSTANWTSEEWDLTAPPPENGNYTRTFAPPGPDVTVDGSLANATVGLTNVSVNDTAHLHSVFLSNVSVWTVENERYVALEGTTGVAGSSDITVLLGDKSMSAELRASENLLVLDTTRSSVPASPVSELRINAPTGNATVAEPREVTPDVRLVNGRVQLWHPAIRNGNEYTVTVHSVDDQTVDNSAPETSTATAAGTVAVPNETDVAAGTQANVSLEGDEVLLDGYNISYNNQPESVRATLVDGRTVRFPHSISQLSVNATIVENDTSTEYLRASDIDVTGRNLTLPGAAVDSNTTLWLRTDAGILQVTLSETQNDGGDGGLLSLLFPAVLLVPLLGLTTIAGVYGGRERGKPDLITTGLLVVIAVCLILALHFTGLMFKLPVVSTPLFVGVLVGMVVTGTGGYVAAGHMLHTGPQSRGRASTTVDTYTISVTVSDGRQPIPGRSKITASREDGSGQVTETVSGGTGQLELSAGTWSIQATHSGYSSGVERVQLGQLSSNERVTLRVDLPEVSLTVTNQKHEVRVPDASVRLDAAGETMTQRTDDRGMVSFDPPLDADTVTITTTHERHDESVEEFPVENGLTETISLTPKMGEVEIVSTVDGVATGDVDIEFTPTNDFVSDLYGSTVTVRTDPDGSYSTGMIIGQYRGEIDLPEPLQDLYRSSASSFEITEGDRIEVTMDVEFRWELSTAQRNRLRQLRSDLDQITDRSGIDMAIPRYYASVVETILDAVEAFPRQGHQFIDGGTNPDELTDATLDAVDAAIETVADAMSTKRNRDLFTACADMGEATVRWRGEFDLPTLADRLQEDQMAVHKTYAARADEVSERIDAERGAVSEVAPARAMLEEVGIQSRGDHVNEVVATHVAIMLLDAVDELFDHDELTARLSRTVF